ncbi:MAG TPA: nuclear transport factor 2 family protein [Gemmatimonadales bacterium]|nr:nuclear transport factor 2 family protein [Gemmatimonadales bacterium]
MRLLLILALTLPGIPAAAQTAADSAAIRAAALDYVEGWYEGNPERMTRALHPELVKRIVVPDTATGRSVLQNMGASALVNGTRHGYGRSTPVDRREKQVRILDIFGNAASARATMADWIDYMQLARVDGRWVIVNVLWERKPERAASP